MKEFNKIVSAVNILDLLALRIDKGWSQVETAKRLGVSYHTLRAWERGARRPRPIVRDCIRRFVEENSKVLI